MIEGFVVFAAQFFFIFLKGVQQINVVTGRYKVAAVVSLGLGVCGLLTFGLIARTVVVGGSWLVFAGYLAGGPLGIMAAMRLEERFGQPLQRSPDHVCSEALSGRETRAHGSG